MLYVMTCFLSYVFDCVVVSVVHCHKHLYNFMQPRGTIVQHLKPLLGRQEM